MRKKIIAIQTLVGLGLYTVGYVAIFSRIPGSIFFAPVMPNVETASLFVFAEMLIPLAGAILVLIGTINSLVKQAKQQQWAWFVFTLFFGPICTLLWLIAVPEVPKPLVPVPMQPEQLVYQPYTQGYGAQQPANAQPEISQEGEQQYQYPDQRQHQQQYEDLLIMYPQEEDILHILE